MYKYCTYKPCGKSLFGWTPVKHNNIIAFYNAHLHMCFPAGYYVELAGLHNEHLCTITYRGSEPPLITFY